MSKLDSVLNRTIQIDDEKPVKKRSAIAGILIFCVLCGVTLFVYSYRFVNVEITPKWMGLMLCVGIAGLTWSIFSRNIALSAKPLIFLACCFLFVFTRKWLAFEFDATLLMYLGGLLLLFLIILQIVKDCKPQYLLGTVIVFSLALSLQGILQYTGALPSGRNIFLVTGIFDNPAGFSAALACTLVFKHTQQLLC